MFRVDIHIDNAIWIINMAAIRYTRSDVIMHRQETRVGRDGVNLAVREPLV